MSEVKWEVRALVVEQIAEFLHDMYRGGPGDLTHPSKRWQDLDGPDRMGWIADAQDILSIVEAA